MRLVRRACAHRVQPPARAGRTHARTLPVGLVTAVHQKPTGARSRAVADCHPVRDRGAACGRTGGQPVDNMPLHGGNPTSPVDERRILKSISPAPCAPRLAAVEIFHATRDGDRDEEGNLGVQRKSEPGVRASGRAVLGFASGPPPWRVAPGKGAFWGGGHRVDRCVPRLAEIRRWRVPWNWRAERSGCFRGSEDRTALAGCAFGRLWQADNRETEDLASRGGPGGWPC